MHQRIALMRPTAGRQRLQVRLYPRLHSTGGVSIARVSYVRQDIRAPARPQKLEQLRVDMALSTPCCLARRRWGVVQCMLCKTALDTAGLRLIPTQSGFTCSVDTAWAQTCQKGAGNLATFPVVTCQSGSSDGLTEMTIPTTVSLSQSAYTITTYEIYAPMIEIRWQSSDLSLNSTSTSSTPAPTAVRTPAVSGSLSTGAKAAIGAVIPVVVLIAIGLSIYFWRRRQSRTGSQAEATVPAQHAHDLSTSDRRPSELRGIALHEMEDQRRAHEMDSKLVANYERHELQGDDSHVRGKK